MNKSWSQYIYNNILYYPAKWIGLLSSILCCQQIPLRNYSEKTKRLNGLLDGLISLI